MLYPRITTIGGGGKLVAADQMVTYKEHMTQNHRTLFFSGIITGETDSRHLMLALDTINCDPIKFVITSAGGDLDSTFLFCDIFKAIRSPVITIGEYCASAAAILLAAGDERYLTPNAKVMLHLPAGAMKGDSKDFEIQHDQMMNYKNRIVELLCEFGAKKKPSEILADIDRDFWLTAQGAIDYGLADEILTPEKWRELCLQKPSQLGYFDYHNEACI